MRFFPVTEARTKLDTVSLRGVFVQIARCRPSLVPCKHGVAVEINANPWRLDLDWRAGAPPRSYNAFFHGSAAIAGWRARGASRARD